jgi:nicotinate phosphoribosyltransferase
MTDGFFVASPEEIRSGEVADVSALRGREVVRQEGEDPAVAAEVRVAALPAAWPWAVLCGVEEALSLLEGHDLQVHALPEGSVFHAEEPVMTIEGRYLEFAVLETALLGLLCQSTGVATAAARCRLAADGRPVYSFGARRMHPAVAPMIERSAYIGGCDGVGTVKAAEVIGIDPVGTMSHAASVVLGDDRAWRGFDRAIDQRVPRVALIDTHQDEKSGAVAAAQTLGKRLAAVRLDTPSSRRGDVGAILREVRWELDARGFTDVKILVTGGVDERTIRQLNRFADAYGVATAISAAPVVGFALDIVEVNGEPRARRGKLSGRKHLWGCPECGNRGLSPGTARLGPCPRCGHRVRALLEQMMHRGKRRGRAPSAFEVRGLALDEIAAAPDPFEPSR